MNFDTATEIVLAKATAVKLARDAWRAATGDAKTKAWAVYQSTAVDTLAVMNTLISQISDQIDDSLTEEFQGLVVSLAEMNDRVASQVSADLVGEIESYLGGGAR